MKYQSLNTWRGAGTFIVWMTLGSTVLFNAGLDDLSVWHIFILIYIQ